jgi:hypothetical protein
MAAKRSKLVGVVLVATLLLAASCDNTKQAKAETTKAPEETYNIMVPGRTTIIGRISYREYDHHGHLRGMTIWDSINKTSYKIIEPNNIITYN